MSRSRSRTTRPKRPIVGAQLHPPEATYRMVDVAELQKEIVRLTGGGLEMTQDGHRIYCSPDDENFGESALLMVIAPGKGSAARQFVLEARRVASIYNDLAAKVQAAVWQDRIEAEIA